MQWKEQQSKIHGNKWQPGVEFDTIAIPWGAAHCHTIEQRLAQAGFVRDPAVPPKERLVLGPLDFQRLLKASNL